MLQFGYGYGNTFSDDDLLSIIHTMCDLEGIRLPWKTSKTMCKQPQRIIDEIVKCLPKLKSFLNSPSNLNVCEIPSLMYKSHPSDLNKIMVKRQGGYQPNPHSTEKPSAKRRKINPKWDTICGIITRFPEALGFRYFYSESYYRNYHLILREKLALNTFTMVYKIIAIETGSTDGTVFIKNMSGSLIMTMIRGMEFIISLIMKMSSGDD